MGPLLALALLAQAPDRTQAILPEVVFEQADAREALRWLFRKGLIGGTIAPDVQGVVTLSLRNVTWETALQNVTRQVDASYRVTEGWFYVVRHEEFTLIEPSHPSADLLKIESSYQKISNAVAAGRGSDLRNALAVGYEDRNATRTLTSEPAIRSLVGTVRAYPRFAVERVDRLEDARAEFIVSYARPQAMPLYYRDFWRRTGGEWRLAAHEETVLNPPLRFKDALISEVLRTVAKGVTIDLTGRTFDAALSELMRTTGLTYRIEGGVYDVVPREPR